MFRSTRRPGRRQGAVLPLTLVFLVAMLAIVAFAVDLGVLTTARTELQRSADAAAIAAAWDLISDDALTGNNNIEETLTNVRASGQSYAALNEVLKAPLDLDANADNDADGGVLVGYVQDISQPNEPWDFTDPTKFNAVTVRARKTEEQGGAVPMFFARVLGMDRVGMEATATAALTGNFDGFKSPADGGNLGILPFALDLATWNALLAGNATDSRKYNPSTGAVTAGSDGIKEVNLFPQGTGSPGNRGTVDIGGSNNSTADIARQIVEGVNADDLAHHGGELEFDCNGEMELNGDTGISAGIKDELASIIGEPRMIPVFSSVTGPGNNADYTIVKFVGVRVMEVVLTGKMSGKRVMVQPCNFVAKGVITSSNEGRGQFIYSPPRLVQ